VTSSGNPEATKSARNTITYALIGLVIVALAQLMVHFVLSNANNTCVNGKNSIGQKC
jgi:ABC-type Fe3+ transport system permease subunit